MSEESLGHPDVSVVASHHEELPQGSSWWDRLCAIFPRFFLPTRSERRRLSSFCVDLILGYLVAALLVVFVYRVYLLVSVLAGFLLKYVVYAITFRTLVFRALQLYQDRIRLYANLRAFLSRSFLLFCDGKQLVPVVIDCLLLVQSTWSRKQPGPDLVYPMLGIKKRQSGRLASLILEHSKDQQSHNLCEHTRGMDSPYHVAVMDLDQGIPRESYSTWADWYGLTFITILVEMTVTRVVHLHLLEQGKDTWDNLVSSTIINLLFLSSAVINGDGTLTLIRRSDTSTPGCAVLLDQDITVILNGKQSTIEAIAESTFAMSFASTPGLARQDYYKDLLHDSVEALCQSAYRLILCYSIYSLIPHGVRYYASIWEVFSCIILQVVSEYPRFLSLLFESTEATDLPSGSTFHAVSQMLAFGFICSRSSASATWHLGSFLFYSFLRVVISTGHKTRDYPIRAAKLIDALGHPHIRKWELETLAAAATFQSLVLCHSIARPIERKINILAFLNVLIPDETDVWTAWKERVADRIVHEDDISFTPTIAMFRDEHQQRQLVDLLDQAQFGHDKYRELYGQSAAADLKTNKSSNGVFHMFLWYLIQLRFLPSRSST